MKPKARWHLWHWKKYQKISCTQIITSLSDGPLRRSGTVSLRVWRSPVFSSLPQSSRWNPGLVPVQWRVNIGQADWRDGGGERESTPSAVIKDHQMEQSNDEDCRVTQRAEVTRARAPRSHTCNRKPTEQLVKNQNYLSTQRKKTCTLLCYPLNFWQVIVNQKPSVTLSYIYIISAFQQERLSKYPEKIKLVSYQKRRAPNWAASQFCTAAGWEHRTALYAAALSSQSTRNNNPMAEMDDTVHTFLKRSLFSHCLLHLVGKGCNEEKWNALSKLWIHL